MQAIVRYHISIPRNYQLVEMPHYARGTSLLMQFKFGGHGIRELPEKVIMQNK